MHELSIAQSVIEIIEEEAKNNHADSVTDVELEIGLVSGVVPDALKFAMDEAIKNTLLEKAKIIYKIIEGKGQCNNCSHEFTIDGLYAMCPECNSFSFEVIQGKELKIKNFSIG
jgi:hydrogenase nickel incorporation protein HypA/HybF